MPQANASVFKAYDIRGESPSELDQKFALRLGQILAQIYKPKRVLVGKDMRLTSPELEAGLIEGLIGEGVDVVRIGLCSTPLFNVSIHLAKGAFDLGVMVTASHNPGKYNGFKMTLGDGRPVGQGTGMENIRELYLEQPAPQVPDEGIVRGKVSEDPEALSRYLDHIIRVANLPADMPKMKVAIDAGNGMAGAILPTLLEKLPWLEAVPLYFEPDGNFPNHEANPLKEETLNDLRAAVKKEGCVLGVAFDGDADRVGFVDERGEIIQGDLLTALIGQEILKDEQNALIQYDVRSSWIVPETIAAAGGRAEMCPVGHATIKTLMRKTGAVFSGELSMHFYYRELGNFESGDYTMLLFLRRIVREMKRMSFLVAPLRCYAKIPETNFELNDARGKIAEIKAAYAPHASNVIEMDGIRLEFRDPQDPSQDWWFNLRASNTEPLLRLNMEARTRKVLDEKKAEIVSKIKG